jgi:hypothetical protein
MTFLDEVRKKLDLPPAEKEQVMRELESHYHEIEDEALNTGMNECEASAEAAKRLGDPSDIAQRMQAVNYRATWRTAILTAVPFLAFILVSIATFIPNIYHNYDLAYLYLAVSASAGSVLLIGSIRQWKMGKRPLWLATWLPGSVTLLATFIDTVIRMLYQDSHPLKVVGNETVALIVYFVLRNCIEILAIGTMIFVACKHSKRQKWTAAGLIIIGLSVNVWMSQVYYCSPDYNLMLPGLIRGVFNAALVIILVTRIFIKHPYGNVTQAFLMIYTLLLPGFPMMINADIGLVYWMTLLSMMISAASITAYSRLPQCHMKTWFLSALIIMQGLLGALISILLTPTLESKILLNMSLIATTLNLIYIIIVPLMIDRYYTKSNPEFAR